MRLRAGLSAAVLVAATGCGAGEATDTSQPAPEPDTTYSGVVPPVDTNPLEEAGSADIDGIQVRVPDDWEVGESDGSLCAQPPEHSECAYGALLVIPEVSDQMPGGWPADDFTDADGWAPRGQDGCRSADTAGGSVDSGDADLTVQGFTDHSDGRTSHSSVWSVDCDNGESFEVRLWFLPQSDVAAYVWSVDPGHDQAYDAIAESMDVSEYAG